MIEARGIVKTYADGTRALDGVDLVVERGMVGLLGPNGAGKSTLLEILTLGLQPSAGECRWFGLEGRASERLRIRSWIGYLAQEFQPLETMSGLEYLVYCGRLRRVRLHRRDLERRALALLEAVELHHVAHRSASTYSGGMKRRLGLAQALVHGPRILLVDEPTAGLDPEERIRFRLLVTDLAEEIPVVLSTHIVEDIEATCSRLVILGGGVVAFDGSPGELMQRMGTGASGRERAVSLEDAIAAFLGLSIEELEAEAFDLERDGSGASGDGAPEATP